MEIRYRNTLEDVIVFFKYHYSNSDTFKKQRIRSAIHMPIFLAMLMVALFAVTQEVGIVIWGSFFIVSYMFFIHRAYKTGLYKTIQKLYREQNTRGFVCEHLLEINEEGILEQTENSERKDKWAGVQRIAIDNDYAFVYVGMDQAHIIPRERVIEGDFDQFIETARTYWQKDNSNQANATDA